MIPDKAKAAGKIKLLAEEFGFHSCGISAAGELDTEARRLREWIDRKFYGSMNYIPDRFDMRIDPQVLMPRARSVISLLYNYYPKSHRSPKAKFIISKYAFGRDYHRVIRSKFKKMVARMRDELGDFDYRLCVDSAPIMEKAWAARSGLGWIGKNTNLINENSGSFFFLSEIIIDQELSYDSPVNDQCGECRKCLDACPTGALVEPYVLDARRCISNLTIENRGSIPEEMSGTYRGWIFGCDICQDVCPFNENSISHHETQFDPKTKIFDLTNNDWRNLTEQDYEELFAGSAVKRAGYDGLKRNIKFVD